MAEKTYIYGLLCPLENKIRYVGKTINPTQRFKNHLHGIESCVVADTDWREKGFLPNPKDRWIAALIEKGLQPKLVILETLNFRESNQISRTDTLWHATEQKWIERLSREGHPLTNAQIVNEVPSDERVLEEALELGRQMFPDSP